MLVLVGRRRMVRQCPHRFTDSSASSPRRLSERPATPRYPESRGTSLISFGFEGNEIYLCILLVHPKLHGHITLPFRCKVHMHNCHSQVWSHSNTQNNPIKELQERLQHVLTRSLPRAILTFHHPGGQHFW